MKPGLRKISLIAIAVVSPVLIVFILLVARPIGHSLPGVEQRSDGHRYCSPQGTEKDLWLRKLALEAQKAFLTSRLEMARMNGVSLSVDLVDSTACLEVKGVELRRCRVQSFSVSAVGEQLKEMGLLGQWLSTPFVLRAEYASLPKVPIRVVEAPQDTVEAESVELELPVEKGGVYVAMYFDRGLSMIIEPVSPPGWKGWHQKLTSRMRDLIESLRAEARILLGLDIPVPGVRVSIELRPEDTKAVYRALPKDGKLSLRM
jgi:hypothetical protein